MARKFLYAVAILIVLVLAGLFALRIWADELTEMAFVPTADFTPQPELAEKVYADPRMWISRPGIGPKDPALWLPPNVQEDSDALRAAVFFIHPTSYLERKYWNPPIDDPVSRDRAELFVKGMASPFNRTTELWAPRYRQAAFGAFLTDQPDAIAALDLAYGDVLEAFDFFLDTVPKDRPIVLAGHSQGAFHLRRLLRDRVAGTPLAGRVAAAYVIGWPVSLEHDLPLMGLPPCAGPDEPGCIMSWLSVAEPADNSMLLKGYARKRGLDGQEVGKSAFLCSNPLTGGQGGEAAADQNLGTLVPDLKAESGELVPGVVPARCGEDGFLYIGRPPDLDFGPYVLPGNNYHLFDVTLFWANLRADVSRRVKAWKPPAR